MQELDLPLHRSTTPGHLDNRSLCHSRWEQPLPTRYPLTPNSIISHEVPKPAPAIISPVGFSSTLISIIFKLESDPLETFSSTEPKMFLDLILATDLLKLNWNRHEFIQTLRKAKYGIIQ